MSVILANWEAEIEETGFEASLGRKLGHILKNNLGGVVHACNLSYLED
jgi:hypothetical protein